MSSAAEVFVVQLARASKRANKFVRELPRADREDVIAAAILWCWENRHNYSLTTTLDTWFVGAVRHAYDAWARGESRNASEQLSEIPTGDTTQAAAAALEAAGKLIRALPSEYKTCAVLIAQGYTRGEIMERGVAQRAFTETRERIKQLRKLLPDDYEYRRVLRAAPTKGSDDVSDELSAVDRRLEKLDWTTSASVGKDCPVCWRCCWYLGFLPGPHKSIRMPIQEPEVFAAVRDTEARKIDIAGKVRDGNL
jgi:DNA-directed RNA polymerase specialized sigma24 family protein